MQQPPLFSSLFSTQTFFHQNASLLINVEHGQVVVHHHDRLDVVETDTVLLLYHCPIHLFVEGFYLLLFIHAPIG